MLEVCTVPVTLIVCLVVFQQAEFKAKAQAALKEMDTLTVQLLQAVSYCCLVNLLDHLFSCISFSFCSTRRDLLS